MISCDSCFAGLSFGQTIISTAHAGLGEGNHIIRVVGGEIMILLASWAIMAAAVWSASDIEATPILFAGLIVLLLYCLASVPC